MFNYAVMYSVGMDPPETAYFLADDALTARLMLFKTYPRARVYMVNAMPGGVVIPIKPASTDKHEVIFVNFITRKVLERKVS